MNRKTISKILVVLAVSGLVGIPVALAVPSYVPYLQSAYGSGLSCGTCHVNPAGGGPRNAYGTLFENQPNHASDPAAALQAIGAPPGASPASTSTPTNTTTPATQPGQSTVTQPNIKPSHDEEHAQVHTSRGHEENDDGSSDD